MASLKRKRKLYDEETLLSQAENTAFQAALFVLDDDNNDGVPDTSRSRVKKKRRVSNDAIAPNHVHDKEESHLVVMERNGTVTQSSNASGLIVQNQVDVSVNKNKPRCSNEHDDDDDDKKRKTVDKPFSTNTTAVSSDNNATRSKMEQVQVDENTTLTLAQVVIRIQLLLAAQHQQEAAMKLCHLMQLYQESFGEQLDFKALGFQQLKLLVQSIPLVQLQWDDGGDCTISIAVANLQGTTSRPSESSSNAPTNESSGDNVSQDSTLDEEPMLISEQVVCAEDKCPNDFNLRDSEVPQATNDESPRQVSLNQVKERIQIIVSRDAPLLLSCLPGLYKDCFHECLEYKKLGFKKLSLLVQSIETIHLHQKSGDILLSLPTSKGKQEDPTLVSERVCAEDKHNTDSNLLGSEVPQATNDKSPRQKSLDQVKERIQLIVSRNAPLLLSSLPDLYKDRFRQGIRYKKLGFKKLGLLVQSIETIHLEWKNDDILLSLPTSKGKQARELVAKTGGRDDQDTGRRDLDASGDGIFDDAEKEVQTRGPSFHVHSDVLAASHTERSVLTMHAEERQATNAKKLPQQEASLDQVKERIQDLVATNAPLSLSSLARVYQNHFHEPLAHKKLGFKKIGRLVETMDSIEIELDKISRKKYFLSIADKSKKFYDCLGCGIPVIGWNEAMEHMKVCCPELIVDCDSSELHRQCVVGNDNRTKRLPGNDQPDSLFRYGCLECGDLQHSWNRCSQHLQRCCPSLLDNRDFLQPRCMLKSDMCDVPGFKTSKLAKDTSLSPYDIEVIRLKRLVATHQPVSIFKVPELYKAMFQGKRLHVRGFGFRSLEQFVEIVPSLRLSVQKKDRVLTIQREPSSRSPSSGNRQQSETESSSAPKKKKAKTTLATEAEKVYHYRCLQCGEPFTKWYWCRSHMRQCCPEHPDIDNAKERCKKAALERNKA